MAKRKKITKKEKQWINEEMEKLNDPTYFRLKETVEPNSNFINLLLSLRLWWMFECF
jgi:hypothetical protein